MPFSKRDQRILADIAKARLIYRELEEVLTFYEKVFQVQFAFKERLGNGGKAGYWEKREINLGDLAGGSPQIRFGELGLETDPPVTLYRDLVKLLIPYAGFPSAFYAEPSPDEIVESARKIFLDRAPLTVSGPEADLVKTASGLALAPYLLLAGERIQPRIPPGSWLRESCPVCGGKPCFAALTSDRDLRTLMCPRCFGEWSYNRIGCPFCSARNSQTYYPGDDGRYRLYVCEDCHHYLKTADARERGLDLCLPVANLVTVSMDLAAQEKGYKF